ncbi:MAG: peptidase C1 [Candidatus Zixiibacteriota bacterium]|nr:MAG: peptidase C1 [candidate division Zixibacteria bacterium]
MLKRKVTISVLVTMLLAAPAAAQSDTVKYVPKPLDEVSEAIRELRKARQEARDSVTDAIRDRQEEQDESERKNQRWIKCDLTGITMPESPDVFQSQFHFPPTRQYWTGTCWSFSTTSFLESEVARLHGRQVRLSEMHTVYYEWLDKTRRFVNERGKSRVTAGSESNAVFRVMKTYGAVPLDVYPGYISDPRHDHEEMDDEIREFLRFVCGADQWDETQVIESVKLIMNKHMGRPPSSFEYEGKTYSPKTFLDEVLKLDFDDYVCIMSTLEFPFYTLGPFDVPDNWWFDSTYYNVPLDAWYDALKNAIKGGYTIALGGDISEAGLNGLMDAAIVPDFDIPQEYINQNSREYRMFAGSTTDDHGVHLVGYTELDGRDWFLVKESSKRGHWGRHIGYMFYRDDYVRLKMMEFAVHKDAVGELLTRFVAAQPAD